MGKYIVLFIFTLLLCLIIVEAGNAKRNYPTLLERIEWADIIVFAEIQKKGNILDKIREKIGLNKYKIIKVLKGKYNKEVLWLNHTATDQFRDEGCSYNGGHLIDETFDKWVIFYFRKDMSILGFTVFHKNQKGTAKSYVKDLKTIIKIIFLEDKEKLAEKLVIAFYSKNNLSKKMAKEVIIDLWNFKAEQNYLQCGALLEFFENGKISSNNVAFTNIGLNNNNTIDYLVEHFSKKGAVFYATCVNLLRHSKDKRDINVLKEFMKRETEINK